MSIQIEKDLLIRQREELIENYLLHQEDVDVVIKTVAQPNPNAEIGIDPKYLPLFTLNVLVTNKEKFVFLPPSCKYSGPEVEEVPNWVGWRWVRAKLNAKDEKTYIAGLKLGNGTAWEQGLQIKGPESAPEWSNLAFAFSEYAVDDPNYTQGQSPAKVIPSIIYPPPSLRAAVGKSHGVERGTEFEMLKMRRHEESHVIEMILSPWPEGAENIEGFPPTDGANTFLTMLKTYGVNAEHPELLKILEEIENKGIMPRSYLGELQAYIGDAIFYANHFGIGSEEFNRFTTFDIESARALWVMKGAVRNYFGSILANTLLRQQGVEPSTRFLNEIYFRMTN